MIRAILENRRGAIALIALAFLVGLTGVALALMSMYSSQTAVVADDYNDARAFYAAEAGRAKARWALTAGAQAVGWTETASPFGANNGAYTVTTEYTDPPDNTLIRIISDGYYPSSANQLAHRRVTQAGITAGGGNLSTYPGVVATAISWNGQNVPNNCRDGATNTKWKSGENKNASWIRLDYGSQKTVVKATLTVTAHLTIGKFECSNNGADWTLLAYTESPPGTYNFTSPTAARYLKLTSGAADKNPEIGEFETYETSGGGLTLSPGLFATTF